MGLVGWGLAIFNGVGSFKWLETHFIENERTKLYWPFDSHLLVCFEPAPSGPIVIFLSACCYSAFLTVLVSSACCLPLDSISTVTEVITTSSGLPVQMNHHL